MVGAIEQRRMEEYYYYYYWWQLVVVGELGNPVGVVGQFVGEIGTNYSAEELIGAGEGGLLVAVAGVVGLGPK